RLWWTPPRTRAHSRHSGRPRVALVCRMHFWQKTPSQRLQRATAESRKWPSVLHTHPDSTLDAVGSRKSITWAVGSGFAFGLGFGSMLRSWRLGALSAGRGSDRTWLRYASRR